MAAFWSLAILALWGARALNIQLGVWFRSMSERVSPDAYIPVLGIGVTPAFLVSALVGGLSVFLLYRWLEKPKTADLLIDTEGELRKVTWPTFKDVVNSSLVVIFCVVFLMAFLAGSDALIARVTKILWFGA